MWEYRRIFSGEFIASEWARDDISNTRRKQNSEKNEKNTKISGWWRGVERKLELIWLGRSPAVFFVFERQTQEAVGTEPSDHVLEFMSANG